MTSHTAPAPLHPPPTCIMGWQHQHLGRTLPCLCLCLHLLPADVLEYVDHPLCHMGITPHQLLLNLLESSSLLGSRLVYHMLQGLGG